MSRLLLLLRHGKSDWDAAFDDDHERPLAARGEKAARRVGRFLSAVGLAPGLALSSTAVRARTTVELAAEAGAWGCPVRLVPRLYGTPPAEVLAEIAGAPDEVRVLLVAGHQPTWGGVVHELTGARVHFPTAAVACIRGEAEGWAALVRQGGELAWHVTPKLLKGLGLPA
ncbi:MAG: histidine phosphatase family protein [Thermoanaerobaculia bacterium]|nr:histidine phosphatase family protein [Thermoanaerobaculia bacterium]